MAKTLEEIIEELRDFSTSELCDGVGAGKYQTMDYHIQERVTYKKIVGPAFTVKTPIGISGLVPEGILKIKKGEIMVIAGKGYCNGSYWGDHRSICAAMKGAEGVVIDGAFRDLRGCRAAGFPIFARGVTPGSAGKESLGELNIPVICGGVRVCPGDIIVGDSNGVIVLKPEEAEEVMERARRKIEAEKYTIQKMRETGEILPRVIMGNGREKKEEK